MSTNHRNNNSLLPVIAIVGGGFSGLATLLHLIDKASHPIHIYLIEKSINLCTGVAFGTESPWHPLNVMASQMGAYAGKPNDFYQWLQNHPVVCQNPIFHQLEISPTSFLPRQLYGLYLKDLLKQAIAKAAEKKIVLEILHEEIINAEKVPDKRLKVKSAEGNEWLVDYLILATGVSAIKEFTFETAELLKDHHYTRNLWHPHAESLFGRHYKRYRRAHERIVILGSGLTAIDALLSLRGIGFEGKIDVISKTGTFPQYHPPEPFPPLRGYVLQNFPDNCRDIFKQFRADLERLQAANHDWRQLIDAMRPYTQKIWKSLSVKAKKQFMRSLFSLWNLHRHRMFPDGVKLLEQLRQNNQLQIVAGYVEDVFHGHGQKLHLRYSSSNNAKQELVVDHVINCSGPEYAISKRRNPLLHALLEKGLIEPDLLGLGLKLNSEQALAGKNHGTIFALGALLFGEKLETTAVPEIREQAEVIADEILAEVTKDREQARIR